MEHNENLSTQHKGQYPLIFGHFINDLPALNRPWTIWDFCGKTAPMPSARRIFSFGLILRLTCADLLLRRRTSAPTVPQIFAS